MRADHLSCYGYSRDTSPSIDALASNAIRFERAYATSSWTKPSVASIMTGLYPSAHTVQHMGSHLPQEAETLAEILSEAGYQTNAVVSHHLISDRFDYAQGFDQFVDRDARGHDHVSTPGVTASALGMLDRLRTDSRPFFLFVHYFDPHFSYKPHTEVGESPRGAGRLHGGERMRVLRDLDPPPTDEERQFLIDLYDGEIRFTDAGIGELLKALDRHGLREETIVVLTADHGEEFYERGWLGHTRTLYDENVRVPLIVDLPGMPGGKVVEQPVSLAALPATLLEFVGVSHEHRSFHAASLLGLVKGGEPEPAAVFAEVDYDENRGPGMYTRKRSAFMRALIRGDHKLILDRYTNQYELYDLSRDPHETRNLFGVEAELSEAMRGELDRFPGNHGPPISGLDTNSELSEAERVMLRELGYIDEAR